MSAGTDLDLYEQTALSALKFHFEEDKSTSISKFHFQQLVNQYCCDKSIPLLHWKSAGFPSLSNFFLHLEEKGFVELNENKSSITNFIKTKKNSKRKSFPPSDRVIRPKRSKMQETVIDVDQETIDEKKNQEASSKVTCPICKSVLQTSDSRLVNLHIDECLSLQLIKEEVSTPQSTAQETIAKPIIGSNYVEEILTKSINGLECSICLERFKKGTKVLRMECLCIFHTHCLERWFQKSKSCPLHTS